jgi:hypothetical protein
MAWWCGLPGASALLTGTGLGGPFLLWQYGREGLSSMPIWGKQQNHALRSIDIDPGCNYVATVDLGGLEVRTLSGTTVAAVPGKACCVRWNPVHRGVLATGDADENGRIRLWRLEANSLTHVDLGNHFSNVTDVAWSADGDELATVATDGFVNLWRIDFREPAKGAFPATPDRLMTKPWIRRISDDGLSAVAWSPSAQTVAVGSFDGLLKLLTPNDLSDTAWIVIRGQRKRLAVVREHRVADSVTLLMEEGKPRTSIPDLDVADFLRRYVGKGLQDAECRDRLRLPACPDSDRQTHDARP